MNFLDNKDKINYNLTDRVLTRNIYDYQLLDGADRLVY